jgi:MGT family glycosyltransferase
MAHFLITVWPFAGHFYPYLSIAHSLNRRGHRIAFYTGAQMCEVAAKEGFCSFSFSHLDEKALFKLLLSRSPRSKSRLKRHLDLKLTFRKWLVDTIPQQIADIELILKQWKVDAIVCDPTVWGPILVLYQKLKIPVAVASLAVGCMLPGRDAPPFGPALPPPRTMVWKWASRLANALMSLYNHDVRKSASQIRKYYGLPPLKSTVLEYMGQMPMHFIPSCPELDYKRRDLPPHVYYVGPYRWRRPRNEDPPMWLKRISRDYPWIHVTEGTVHVDSPLLLKVAAEGLAGHPMQVIMTTGGNREPEEIDIGLLASNIHLKKWIYHSDLFPFIDLLVTTGGAGNVLTALSEGIPMVIIPTEWDKPENARRVVEAGVGLQIAPHLLTPTRLVSAIYRILNDFSFKQRAQKIAASFSNLGGAEQVAQLLESMLSSSTPLAKGISND